MMHWTILLCLLAAPPDDGATKPPPKLAGKISKGREKLDIVAEKDGGVRLRLQHVGGIGAAEIKLEEGEWPRLRLELVNFQYLEYFRADTGPVRLSAKLRDAPAANVYVRLPDGTERDESKQERWKVPMSQKGDTILIDLPPDLFPKDVKTLRIEWIDAFRR